MKGEEVGELFSKIDLTDSKLGSKAAACCKYRDPKATGKRRNIP